MDALRSDFQARTFAGVMVEGVRAAHTLFLRM